MNRERWNALMTVLGISPSGEIFDDLLAAYSEQHRHYHTVQHIDDCLSKLDVAKHLAQAPEEIEIALWFHDAIYDPYKSGNEEKSADWACKLLSSCSVDPVRVQRVREHILATQHQVVATNPDAQLLVDIDLSILGATESDYAAFEKNVREEYKWVPAIVFRKKRAEILQSFLDRSQIFNTELFRCRYEQQARTNLAAAVAALSA